MGDAPSSSEMRSICIIGAGPAGLVAAKTFLQTGRCRVTVYEKSHRLGGIWALDEDSTGGYLHPRTPTNLSRFSVGFSDLAWSSVDLGSNAKGKLPMFPKAWQVGRYLEEYRRRHLPEGMIKYGMRVSKAEKCKQLAIGSKEFWRVTAVDADGREECAAFDHLVVATGFFAKPRPLQHSVDLRGQVESLNMLHSSQYRSLRDLLPPSSQSLAGKKILLIGGGNSAGEAAATIASHLSNAHWSPDTTQQEAFEGCRVIHTTPRPIYALPPFTPANENSTVFMPLDFNFYDLSRRLPGPITGNAGKVPETVKEMLHGVLRKTIGSDQSDLGSDALVVPEGTERGTVQVALAEAYAEFVRSGLIGVSAGRITSISERDERVVAKMSHGGASTEIADIGAVVYATGYSPSPALDMLHPQVKEALHFDEKSMRLPLILEQWQTISKAVPNLAFIGFYEGPYWGVMEMQSRLIAQHWLNEQEVPTKPYEEVSKMLDLRNAMQERALDVPQYWFGDYAGYVEELASMLKLERNDGDFKERTGTVSPARYLNVGDDRKEANMTMRDLFDTWQACQNTGTYTARAALRALQGNWDVHRRITSYNDTYPSGVLTGTASFHFRAPTDAAYDLEYLYVESGTFTLSTGATMNASRRYVYSYSEAQDKLSVWFVKPAHDLEVDYLFHDLTFAPPAEAEDAGHHIAKADHLCVKDMYWTEYRLPIKGIALQSFQVEHKVKGPDKDYVSFTDYRRPEKSA
ncbi:hypothetical protein LTR95_017892, partial [Oleoguttula sp. CCFEE 5521]